MLFLFGLLAFCFKSKAASHLFLGLDAIGWIMSDVYLMSVGFNDPNAYNEGFFWFAIAVSVIMTILDCGLCVKANEFE